MNDERPEIELEMDGPRAVAPVENESIMLDMGDDARPSTTSSKPAIAIAPVVIDSKFCTCNPAPLAARRVGTARIAPKFCSRCDKERAPLKTNATPAATTSSASAHSDFGTVASSTSVRPGESAPVVVEKRVVLQKGDLVAGAAATGHGKLIGWEGKGNLTRAQIVKTITDAGLPDSWAPEARSARAQAGNAVATLRAKGYVVRNQRDGERAQVEAHDALWTIVQSGAEQARVGEPFGNIVLVVTLTAGVLRCQGDAELGQEIERDYQRRIGGEIYRATDVSKWLVETLYARCESVKFGGIWYVPRRYVEIAERLCNAFSRAGWGTDWLLPALPIATSAQLQDGFVIALTKEVDDVCAQLETQRENARGKGHDDVGQRAATSHLLRVREITERVVAYGALLGEERVAALKARLATAAIEVDELLDDGMGTSQRFALLWEEVERDVKKNGGSL